MIVGQQQRVSDQARPVIAMQAQKDEGKEQQPASPAQELLLAAGRQGFLRRLPSLEAVMAVLTALVGLAFWQSWHLAVGNLAGWIRSYRLRRREF